MLSENVANTCLTHGHSYSSYYDINPCTRGNRALNVRSRYIHSDTSNVNHLEMDSASLNAADLHFRDADIGRDALALKSSRKSQRRENVRTLSHHIYLASQ